MPDYILPILGHLAYFAFLAWLIIVTYINFIILPVAAVRQERDWNIKGRYVTLYVVCWALVFTIPAIPALVQGG